MIFFIVFGASGDLASRKTFPSLLSLLLHNHLQINELKIIGYSRTPLSTEQFHSHFNFANLPAQSLELYKQNISYFKGSYDNQRDFDNFSNWLLSTFNPDLSKDQCICYLALPPSQFLPVATNIKLSLDKFINLKIVIEKPFGTDSPSSALLSTQMSALFSERQLFRIDHYLGKEMVKNIYTLRFCNHFFSAIWNSSHISSVQITFKETIGVTNRAGYFDSSGIVRDVMQNHLMQILSIISMEPPASLNPNDIQDEKVKVLRCIKRPILEEHCVFGQYEGYQNEEGVRLNSNTPTFASVIFFIENERWNGVPFVLKCGKALNESKAEIRIQLKDATTALRYFPEGEEIVRNELVIRVQPKEAIYLKLNLKRPGTFEYRTEVAELDLTYASRFQGFRIPDAYESLILDIINDDHSSFVRSDELHEAWQIIDSVVQHSESHPPILYAAGTRGPLQSDQLIQGLGKYKRHSREYSWPKL